MKVPAMESITIAYDSNEQRPYLLHEFPKDTALQRHNMFTADWCPVDVCGLLRPDLLLVDSKHSTSDLLGGIGGDRRREEDVLTRMRDESRFPVLLLDDCTWADLFGGNWRCPSKLTVQQVVGTLCAWAVRFHVRIVPAGTRRNAARWLWQMCRRVLLDDAKLAAEKGATPTLEGPNGIGAAQESHR